MDRLRVVLATILVGVYLAAVVADFLDPGYGVPSGLALGFGIAVSFLLGGPAIDRIKNFTVDVREKKPNES